MGISASDERLVDVAYIGKRKSSEWRVCYSMTSNRIQFESSWLMGGFPETEVRLFTSCPLVFLINFCRCVIHGS